MAFFSCSWGSSRASLLAWLPLLSSCSIFGGQSSDDTGGECPTQSSELETDATVSSLGFAPNDVLDWALGSHVATAHWQASRDGISTNAGEGDTQVTVSLARGSGPATEQTSCVDTRVHVPLSLQVSTADGLVQLDADADLTAARGGFVQVLAELEFDDLTGTFSWESEQPGVTLVQPTVALALTPHGLSGAFNAIRQVTTSSGITDTADPLGGLLVWPAGSACTVGQVPLVVADADPIWTEGPAMANAAPWVERGGASDGVPVVIALDVDSALCESDMDPPRLPARLTLRTNDAVIDHQVDGHVVLTEGGAQFTNEHVRYWWTPDEFVERVGDFGEDLSGYENMELLVTVALSGEAGEGSFVVQGAVDDCQSTCDESGCSGCGPMREEVVVERGFVTVADAM